MGVVPSPAAFGAELGQLFVRRHTTARAPICGSRVVLGSEHAFVVGEAARAV